MKNILIFLAFIILSGAGGLYIYGSLKKETFSLTSNPSVSSPTKSTKINSSDDPQITAIAENLNVPWGIAFLPSGEMLVTERPGSVRRINKDGKLDLNPVAVIQNVNEIGEGGLLGIDIHPNFEINHFVYLYYTYAAAGDDTKNSVIRMKYENNSLSTEEIIVDDIPGAVNHNGGRIKFGPDGFLYIGTGDAQNPSQAQNKNSLAGKILRITDEGKIPFDNPFNNPVFSYGHRNVQGLAWDSKGRLWATEHGRSGIQSGLDEINLIEKGKNYGWPEIQGDETRIGMETPRKNSGDTTWAPSGAAFVGNSFFFAGLRGQTLYEAVIENDQVRNFKEYFSGEYGRLREIVYGPDRNIFITTSNMDGRGNPHRGDDKVIRIHKDRLISR